MSCIIFYILSFITVFIFRFKMGDDENFQTEFAKKSEIEKIVNENVFREHENTRYYIDVNIQSKMFFFNAILKFEWRTCFKY